MAFCYVILICMIFKIQLPTSLISSCIFVFLNKYCDYITIKYGSDTGILLKYILLFLNCDLKFYKICIFKTP